MNVQKNGAINVSGVDPVIITCDGQTRRSSWELEVDLINGNGLSAGYGHFPQQGAGTGCPYLGGGRITPFHNRSVWYYDTMSEYYYEWRYHYR